MRPLLLAILLTLASPASAQDEAPATWPERLYINPGVLLGSTRMVGLGGAYVGIAEGAEGFVSNLAALAHRNPRLARDWDLDATLSWLDVPLGGSRGRDLDNDGLPDEARSSFQFLAAMSLQYQRYGLGFFLNTRRLTYCATAACDAGDAIEVSLTNTAFAGAVALGQDDFLLGVGIHAAEAVFSQLGEDWRYGGTGLFRDTRPRPHVTGGFELFLFRYLEDWALSASFDVARRYSNLGVSVGFWR